MSRKDEKYIKRLKDDIAALQAQNRSLESKLTSAVGHIQNCDTAVRALNEEAAAARRIIWAVAHSQGGRVEIPDNHMVMAANDTNQITSEYDPTRKVTVISASEGPILNTGKDELVLC